MGSPGYLRRLGPTGKRAMAGEPNVRPLTGSPPGRLKLGGLRALRGGRDCSHDFNDSALYWRMHRECRRIYTWAFGAISDSEWDVAFNFAYGQGWRSEREKGPIDRLAAWLTTAAHNAVVSEHRKTARVEPLATDELLTEQAVRDLAETMDDRQVLRDVIFCLKTHLPERVRLVWTMRFAGDYEPGEIQQQLQISKKAYEKDLELASRLVVSHLESARKTGVCDTPDMTSMVRAYAIWGEEHGAERAKLAREHLKQCPACRRTVLVLRAAQRAAVFLPPPILELTVHHSPPLGVVLQTTENLVWRIQDGLWRLTERAHDGLLRMKYLLIKVVSRGPVSSPVNTDRTATVLGASGTGGAALATKAVVGCLAAGVLASGTGACLKAAGVNVPGLSGVIDAVTGSHLHKSHKSGPAYEAGQVKGLNTTLHTISFQDPWTRAVPHPYSTAYTPHTTFKDEHRRISSAVAAQQEFGTEPSNTPKASSSDTAVAREEFSTTSHVARAASSEQTTVAQATSTSASHTDMPPSKSPSSAAEREFGGP
jgi:DNA-directed RNA polymerase specialized sigma24 family protein